ncbi:TPA: ParB N-terminal domain-containing protein [Aeromonas veronii]|nr:ParB N-terminal domain-containing protein [Aeromonas veronii]
MTLGEQSDLQAPPQVLITSFDKLKKLHNEEVKKNDLYLIAPHLIEEEEGFNPRDYTTERMEAHIESLAKQWETNPSLIPPLMVVLKDGHVYVRDGHCRLRAAKRAIERGVELKTVTCVQFRGNDVDQSVLILTSQEGAKLNFVEVAKVYARLNAQGITDTEIAARLNKTAANIFTIRKIATLPNTLQGFIADQVISYQEALSLVDKVGETRATELVQEILNDKLAKLGGVIEMSPATAPVDKNTGTGEDPASVKPAKKVKVVGSDIQRKLGGTGVRFNAKMKQGSADVIKSLASQLDANKGAQKVVLNADLVQKLLELSELLKSDDDNDGDAENQGDLPLGGHPHEALVKDID